MRHAFHLAYRIITWQEEKTSSRGQGEVIPIYHFPNINLPLVLFPVHPYYSHRFPAGLPSQIIPFWHPDCSHSSLLFLHLNSTFVCLHILWLIISVTLSSPLLHRCPCPCNNSDPALNAPFRQFSFYCCGISRGSLTLRDYLLLQTLFSKPQYLSKRGEIAQSPTQPLQSRWGADPVQMKLWRRQLPTPNG